MFAKYAQGISALIAFLLGVLLALNLHAENAEPTRNLPAGIVKIPLNIHAHNPKIEFSHDKKLIVSAATHRNRSSEAVLFRFVPNGKLDPSFGNAGIVTTRADGRYASITSLVPQSLFIQPDGKIVVAGEASTNEMYSADFLLMRFLPDGRPDKSLDGRGWAVTGVWKSHDQAHDIVVLPDGKIVTVGGSLQSSIWGSRYDFAIVRYLPDGRLDQQFAEKGKAIVRLGSASEDIAYAVKPDAKGDIFVAGRANTRQTAEAIALLRLDKNGQLDKTFGKDGKVIPDFGAASRAHSLSIQPDHMILVAGALYYQQPGGWVSGGVALRYDESGKPDNAFGAAGVVRLPWVSELNMVKTQRDGKIVLLGTRQATSQKQGAMVVIRVNPDGTLDQSFGERGTASIEFASYLMASGMAISDSNEIYVCGMTGYRFQDPAKNPDNGLILFKLNQQGKLDGTFGN